MLYGLRLQTGKSGVRMCSIERKLFLSYGIEMTRNASNGFPVFIRRFKINQNQIRRWNARMTENMAIP